LKRAGCQLNNHFSPRPESSLVTPEAFVLARRFLKPAVIKRFSLEQHIRLFVIFVFATQA
jgi:hypothetical protein